MSDYAARRKERSLCFESRLGASPARIWRWITSVDGIATELRPLLRMTAPREVQSIEDLALVPGQRLFRSYVFLLGIIPIDYSDMTLLEIEPGRGFIEQSPMGSMRLWRHERRILPCVDEPGMHRLVDKLTFQPRWMAPVVGWFIRQVFTHRHRRLRAHLGGEQY